MKITCESNFHPVGHGLFYTAEINNFRVVYDCGSQKGKKIYEPLINNLFSDNREKSDIDLLIISHFHSDHINGIPRLIDGRTVKNVVIPFLENEEKLLLLSYLNGAEFESFGKLISSPEYFFKGVQNVVKIKAATGEPNKGSDSSDIPLPNQEWGEFYWSENLINGEVSTYGHTASFSNYFWSFKFYTKPLSSTKMGYLKKVLNKNSELIEKLADGSFSENEFSELKKIFNSGSSPLTSTDQNATSLVCCHGPKIVGSCVDALVRFKCYLEAEVMNTEYECLHEHFYHRYIRKNSPRYGINLPTFQMLTGDAELSDETEYKAHFFDVLNKVILFQVPHHGSKHNWKDWFTMAHPLCNKWIVTHNDDNKHRGRGTYPCDQIKDFVVSVTEKKGTKFRMTLHIN